MQTVKKQLETTYKSYDELTGVRDRQLDRPLEKIDEVRQERGIEAAQVEATFEKVMRKKLTATASDVV
jgi:hypothetical protein